MSTKPILFNTDMVRRILDGTKTVARKVVNPQYGTDADGGTHSFDAAEKNRFRWSDHPNVWTAIPYPYHPGDILYVRETWCKTDCFGLQNGYVYKANDNSILDQTGFVPKWHPSIHMPREAARIFLLVTDVRVERLQDITEEQARAEGISPVMITTDVEKPDDEKEWHEWAPALPGFIGLWDSTIRPGIRALYGWGANPWVWVIEFERISREEAAL